MFIAILLLFVAALLVAARVNRYASRSRRKRRANWDKIVDQIRQEDLDD
jgi:hypothetical protein